MPLHCLFACCPADTTGVTRLNGLRITGTSRRAVLEGDTLHQTLQARRPTRQAQVAAANKAAAAAAKKAAEDDSAAMDSDAPAPAPPRRGPGRPPFTAAQRQAAHLRRMVASAEAGRHAITASSITVAKKTADVDEALTAAFESWMKMQPAGGMALERGGTYGHLHIQAVVKAFGATPQQVNRAIKVSINTCFGAGALQTHWEWWNSVCIRLLLSHCLLTASQNEPQLLRALVPDLSMFPCCHALLPCPAHVLCLPMCCACTCHRLHWSV